MTVISERFDDLGKGSGRNHQNTEDNASCRRPRLGIMGGTFDPIHIGHLACAEQARESLSLDAVIFIPAGVPVYKKKQVVTSAHHRLEMCRMAVASNPSFDVSAIEIERKGDTYTVDTLRQLRKHYSDQVELYFITGADAVFDIIKWRESSAIADLAHLIAVTRPGYQVSEEQKEYLAEHSGFDISYLEVTALAISSSDLRQKVSTGHSIRYLTTDEVADYINAYKLYHDDLGESCAGEL